MTTSVEMREKYSMQDAVAIFLKFVILIWVFGVASDVNRHGVGTIMRLMEGILVAIVIPPVAVVVRVVVKVAIAVPA